MENVKDIFLLKDSKKIILKAYSNNKGSCFKIPNKESLEELRRKELIDINSMNAKTYKLTEKGKEYCEYISYKESNERSDNIIKWCTLAISILAIVLSLLSLIIQFKDYKKNDTSSETVEISSEKIDTNNTTESDISFLPR